MAIIKMRRKAKGDQGSNPERASGEAPAKKRGACELCDDGGDLICCDGGCRRSFHPTKEHGEDSMCTTLGLTEEEWQTHVARGDQALYICKNCEYNQHQCFACGLLGSSDLNSRPEVLQCNHQMCGHFYHPSCVAKLLYPDSENRAVDLEKRIAGGLEFHCPTHQCKLCKEAENKDDKEMRFAVCRRCPTVYHRKCLPRFAISLENGDGYDLAILHPISFGLCFIGVSKILFPHSYMFCSDISFKEFEETGNPRRAWGKILPEQILIYCMKHEIQQELGTPKRDHIVFPDCRNASAAKRAGGAPQLHDILEEDELLDHPSSSKSSQSPQPAESGHDRVKPIDSFAPKHLFPCPQPGSCGWLDE